MKTKDFNVLTLAYIGDAIYEVFIRKNLIEKGIVKVKNLQKEAVEYVSARAQAKFLKEMLDINFFSEEELEVIYRARNNKGKSHPKNTDILTYKHATALEAIIGYFYLDNNENRLHDVMNFILEKK
ncbi:MAG TPA: ribonuclease III [Tenericutes bacterium]|nr:ribonuclease III [Mycoplasmatota bacterium]